MRLMSFVHSPRFQRWLLLAALLLIGLVVLLLVGYRVAYAGKIYPGVAIGDVDVSGLTFAVAKEKVQARINTIQERGVVLEANGQQERISAATISYAADDSAALQAAQNIGRSGSLLSQLIHSLPAFEKHTVIMPTTSYHQEALDQEVQAMNQLFSIPTKDVRLQIADGHVDALYDTAPGSLVDVAGLEKNINDSLQNLRINTIQIPLVDASPTADPKTVPAAMQRAEAMINAPLILVDQNEKFPVSTTTIGGWIHSVVQSGVVTAVVDDGALSDYVASFAASINRPAKNLDVQVDATGHITSFIAPVPGRVVNEDQTIAMIKNALVTRANGQTIDAHLTIPLETQEPTMTGNPGDLGIHELIGSATTPFTGSPANRILNIKHGTQFLSGQVVAPGEEFSTLKALGKIDNTTGYLPELVIKGNRTEPDFGGGLCQVSTTLFRAVLNAGLPVTARTNHSYRVTYYEKDGEGNKIGPGLDATIFEPAPDFRFLNDTATSILVTGYVTGDKLTFDLYGTKDGRSSNIDGPKTLSTTPPGDPITAETTTLAPGVKKQIEHPHPGGSAIATYTVTYADGTVKQQVFKSYYRPWPAQFLVGVASLPPGTVDPGIMPPLSTTSPQSAN